MKELPDVISSGEVARLIPVIADSRKEQRATSVFLATLTAIPQFAQAISSSIGQRVGTRTVVDTYTEVTLKSLDPSATERPDGFVRLRTGKNVWMALVEAKIGSAKLSKEQVEQYLRLAKANGIEALITISNQFATLPDHHPISVKKMLTRKTSLFHWSWTYILTEAILLQENKVLTDPDQAFILREFIRFFSHDSAGVIGFDQMPADWKGVIDTLQRGGSLKKSRNEIAAVIAAWHQELRDIALGLSRHLGRQVSVRISKKHEKDMASRLADDVDHLEKKHSLIGSIAIPDAASDIHVEADLKSRILNVSMTVDAPADRATGKARINWIRKQLTKCEIDGVSISAIWPSKAPDTTQNLSELRQDSLSILSAGSKTPPRAFRIGLTVDNPRRFSGRRTFIEDLESVIPSFYDNVGQHLQRWQPKPPKPIRSNQLKDPSHPDSDAGKRGGGDEEEKTKPVPVKLPMPGNKHTELLEIPAFLKRLE